MEKDLFQRGDAEARRKKGLRNGMRAARERDQSKLPRAVRSQARDKTMAISFRIPNYLASLAGGQTSLEIDTSPETVDEALESLWKAHPVLRDRIVDEQGEVRQHINIFVGDEA